MFLILYAFPFLQIFQTSWVNINIVIEGQRENTVVLIKPINDSLFLSYPVGNNEIVQEGNRMNFRIDFNGNSFFLLKINNEVRIPIALKGGDNINLHVTRKAKEPYVEYKIEFSGANASAHSIYQERFFPPGKNFGYFRIIAEKAKSLDDYFLQSKFYIDSLTYVWDSLKQNLPINEAIYKLYIADTRGMLFNEAIKKINNVQKEDSSVKVYMERQFLKQVFFHHADASNLIHLKTSFSSYLYNTYLSSILSNDPSIQDKDIATAELRHFYYYDSSYREIAWGGYLLNLKRNFSSSTIETENNKLYRRYFPNSSFLKQIDNYNDSLIKVRIAINEPVRIDSAKYKSLQVLLNQIKERYVFVDVWATWCMPCIAEFNYLPQLTKFLKTKNISQAFLSIDKESDKEKWIEFIKKNAIPGYHFRSSDTIETDLLKIFSKDSGEGHLFIPRYFIYDREQDKYHIDLPKPSTEKVLENVIEEIIRNDKM